MNINFHLEKQDQHFSVTAFPKIVGNFLQEDIFQYKDNIDDLTEKLLAWSIYEIIHMWTAVVDQSEEWSSQ